MINKIEIEKLCTIIDELKTENIRLKYVIQEQSNYIDKLKEQNKVSLDIYLRNYSKKIDPDRAKQIEKEFREKYCQDCQL